MEAHRAAAGAQKHVKPCSAAMPASELLSTPNVRLPAVPRTHKRKAAGTSGGGIGSSSSAAANALRHDLAVVQKRARGPGAKSTACGQAAQTGFIDLYSDADDDAPDGLAATASKLAEADQMCADAAPGASTASLILAPPPGTVKQATASTRAPRRARTATPADLRESSAVAACIGAAQQAGAIQAAAASKPEPDMPMTESSVRPAPLRARSPGTPALGASAGVFAAVCAKDHAQPDKMSTGTDHTSEERGDKPSLPVEGQRPLHCEHLRAQLQAAKTECAKERATSAELRRLAQARQEEVAKLRAAVQAAQQSGAASAAKAQQLAAELQQSRAAQRAVTQQLEQLRQRIADGEAGAMEACASKVTAVLAVRTIPLLVWRVGLKGCNHPRLVGRLAGKCAMLQARLVFGGACVQPCSRT